MALIADSFEQLAARDPAVAPLARLQAVALQAAADPAWDSCAQALAGRRADPPTPLLHGLVLRVDPANQRDLLRCLVAVLAELDHPQARSLDVFVSSGEADPLTLLEASLRQDRAQLNAMTSADVDADLLAVVAHQATLPLLLACGRRAGSLLPESWPHGYCPLCAAWPNLAEVRGLERNLILRCGRCGSGWRFDQGRCVFCDNREQGAQGYFAAEQERESRRAAVCERCRGYLKTQATLLPLTPAELLLRDLDSLELDLAAIEQDYGRPEAPGWELSVRIEPASARGARWLRWRS